MDSQEMQILLQAINELKDDIQSVRTELKDDIQSVRTELKDVRTELKDDIQSVRTELKDDIQSVRSELEDVRQELLAKISAVSDIHVETREICKALTHASELNNAKMDGLILEIAQLNGQMKQTKDDICFLEEAFSKNTADIAKIKKAM